MMSEVIAIDACDGVWWNMSFKKDLKYHSMILMDMVLWHKHCRVARVPWTPYVGLPQTLDTGAQSVSG